MLLQEFIHQFDTAGSVVLLEGKRQVRPQDEPLLEALGRLLASHTHHMVFRSGNAEGADQFFANGVAEVAPHRLEVIVPYAGHRKKYNKAPTTYALDELTLPGDSPVVKQTLKMKPGLVQPYLEGAKNRRAINAAYLLRDTLKALGTEGIPQASFGLFYDDLDNPLQGGTGHTMRICTQNNIPLADQRMWMQWLREN
jgi:hypothetical protein